MSARSRRQEPSQRWTSVLSCRNSVGETPAQSTDAGCKASRVISAKEVAVQWRKPIADHDSGIRVELTLNIPSFPESRQPGDEISPQRVRDWPDEKRGLFRVWSFPEVSRNASRHLWRVRRIGYSPGHWICSRRESHASK